MAETEPEVISADFVEKKVVERIKLSPDAAPVQLLRSMAKFAKTENVKSVLIMTVCEKNHVEWVIESPSEHHMCLAALSLDDIKEELKAAIFGDEVDIGDA